METHVEQTLLGPVPHLHWRSKQKQHQRFISLCVTAAPTSAAADWTAERKKHDDGINDSSSPAEGELNLKVRILLWALRLLSKTE